MNTTFAGILFLTLAAAGCSRVPRAQPGAPAPLPDSAAAADARAWRTVRVEDAYGAFEMRVPALRVTAAKGSGALLVDSAALAQVEKRLTGRMNGIARAAAASLRDTLTDTLSARHPAPAIRRGLLATVSFPGQRLDADSTATERIRAAARLARELDGELAVIASVAGTAPADVDAALVRARQVYFDLMAAAPALAERPVSLHVQTRPVLTGAPVRAAVVEVYITR